MKINFIIDSLVVKWWACSIYTFIRKGLDRTKELSLWKCVLSLLHACSSTVLQLALKGLLDPILKLKISSSRIANEGKKEKDLMTYQSFIVNYIKRHVTGNTNIVLGLTRKLQFFSHLHIFSPVGRTLISPKYLWNIKESMHMYRAFKVQILNGSIKKIFSLSEILITTD